MWFSRHDPEYASLGTEMRVLLATGSGGFDRVGGPGALGESINTIPSLIDDCPTCSALP